MHGDIFCFTQSFAVDTRHVVAVASRRSFNPHTMSRSFPTLRIPNTPLTRFWLRRAVHFQQWTRTPPAASRSNSFKHCPPLMITPAATDRRVTLSRPQSASEYASRSPTCCQWNKHSVCGFPTRYLPILLTRSRLDADGFAIAQHTCTAANLRSGRSCDN